MKLIASLTILFLPATFLAYVGLYWTPYNGTRSSSPCRSSRWDKRLCVSSRRNGCSVAALVLKLSSRSQDPSVYLSRSPFGIKWHDNF